MALIISNSRGTCLKMAHPTTPSSSFRGADMIDLTADGDDMATIHNDDDVIAKNRVVISQYESFSFVIHLPLRI